MNKDHIWRELEELAKDFEQSIAADGMQKMDVTSAEALLRRNSPIASEEQIPSELFDTLSLAFGSLVGCASPTILEVVLHSIGQDTPPMFVEMGIEVFASVEANTRAEVLKSGIHGAASYAALLIAEYLPDRSFVEELADVLRTARSPDVAIQAADALSAIITLDTKSEAESRDKILKMEFPLREWVHDEWESRGARVAALNKVRVEHLSNQALEALERKDYQRVIDLLAPHERDLSQTARRKLAIARRRLK